ncbi:MAG: rhodanese-like domain-containing protein [Myxococcota bacterium]
MKRLTLSLTAALALAVPAAALACEGEHQAHQPAVQTLTVEQLALLQQEKKASTVDANGEKTRAKHGVIPGAILLTSAVKYDPAKELPAAKETKLVFYCANEKCSSAKNAAERALEAGYQDVAVLPVGIMGWKSAGKKTDLPRS